jgi:hypothetical protein
VKVRRNVSAKGGQRSFSTNRDGPSKKMLSENERKITKILRKYIYVDIKSLKWDAMKKVIEGYREEIESNRKLQI